MKTFKTLIVMLIVLLTLSFVACNSPDTKNNNSMSQTDTLGMKKVMSTDTMYTCKMHQEVMSDKPGKCPKCGMTLMKQKMTAEQMKMMKEGTYAKPKE